jgi:hypothetical protein
MLSGVPHWQAEAMFQADQRHRNSIDNDEDGQQA